ncbi:hypothetical protein LTR94_035895, partial [Friedmanniomyces endolithicus]
AVRGHGFVNPYDDPGEQDLTAHVDFGTLIEAARAEDAVAFGPVDQGALLKALGIDARTQALAARSPERADQLRADRDRLVEEEQMGTLFKAIAITSPGWPVPAGFAA